MSSETSSSELDDRASSSVLELTKQCISLFEGCAASNQNGRSSAMETRLADLRLWAAGIGAISEDTESLDFIFQSKPDDLFLVKTILIMLADFVADYSALLAEGQPISDAVERIDSTLENLIIISASIRDAGKTLRRYRAAPRFDPRDYEELRRHLECVILLRPSKSGLQSELNPFNLSIVQKRLIEANLQRRHRFVIARKGFRKQEQGKSHGSKDGHSPQGEKAMRLEGKDVSSQPTNASVAKLERTLESSPPTEDNVVVGAKEPLLPGQGASQREKSDRTARGDILSKEKGKDVKSQSQEPPGTISQHSHHRQTTLTRSDIKAALTGDETHKTKEKRGYVPGHTKAHIMPLVTPAEFPKPPPNFKGGHLSKCPCCCQEIPIEGMLDSNTWRKHIDEDLLPYTCIIEDCPTPQTALFGTLQEWKAHVQADHKSQWHCPLCDETNTLMESEEAIVHHFKAQHPSDVNRFTLETLLSWSKRKLMGITSCPLCYSYGREDSPELVDHVLKHVYEFSLRSLPWTKPVTHISSQAVGTFTLPQDKRIAEALLGWLEGVEDKASTVPQLPVLEITSSEIEIPEVIDDTDYVPDNEYFDTKWTSEFSRQSPLSSGSANPFTASSQNQAIATDPQEGNDRKSGTQKGEDPTPPGLAGPGTLQHSSSSQPTSRTQPPVPTRDHSQRTSLAVGTGSTHSAKRRGEAHMLKIETRNSKIGWGLKGGEQENLILGIWRPSPFDHKEKGLGPALNDLGGDEGTISRARGEISAVFNTLGISSLSFEAMQDPLGFKLWLSNPKPPVNWVTFSLPGEYGLYQNIRANMRGFDGNGRIKVVSAAG